MSRSRFIMLRTSILMVFIMCGVFVPHSGAQVFWTEGFGLGCARGQIAINASFPNGTWTITATGQNDPFANEWYISAAEAGFPPGTCRDGCVSNVALSNQTLHVGNVQGSPNDTVLCLLGDCGAVYDPGGFLPAQVETHKRIESPVINCTGKFNITVAFNYFENGSFLNDNATLWYFDSIAWTQIDDPAKTSTTNCPGGAGYWTAYSFQLPPSANDNGGVKIGFEWINNDDANGTNPSFAVDDITLLSVPPPVVANFTVDTLNGGCAGSPRQFTNTSLGNPTGFIWYFPGANLPLTSTSPNPVKTYPLPGSFNVTLVAYNATDTDSVSRTITIVNCSFPVADFYASDTIICQNDTINFFDLSQNATSWNWSLSGGTPNTSTAANPANIVYPIPGFYNATLTVTNANGSSSISKVITVNSCPPPTGDFGTTLPPAPTCDTCADFFDLSTNSPNTWNWSFPGATPDFSTDQNPTHICYETDGLYDVILIVGNDHGTDTVIKYSLVNISNVPTATISDDLNGTGMLFGEKDTLRAGGGVNYQWYVPGVADTTQWGIDSTNVPVVVASPAYTTTYYCIITGANGCTSIRQITVVIIRKDRVFIPNAFSPDDGKEVNHIFRIFGNNIFSARLVVYDRWGEKVFETDDKDTGWDGTYNGERLNAGVYTYAAFVIYELGNSDNPIPKVETLTGTIALIR